MPDPLIRKVERRILGSIREFGTRWVVAVSGGSDSVGLLRILHALPPSSGLWLSVAHLDHGTRAEASRADADLAAGLADALGLPFDLGHWHATRTGHFEADARRARYAWLTDVARARGASVVAVGHTSDDQAETIMHRIVRGTGIRGLAGIPEARTLLADPAVMLVRPLLGVSRAEIREHLARLGQSFRDDATNADIARTRSRIRHDLIPKIEAEYNPRFAEALARLGELAEAANGVIEDRLLELEPRAIRETSPCCVVLDRLVLAPLGRFLAIELMRRAWHRAGWPELGMSAERWNRLHDLTAGRVFSMRISVGAGVDAMIKGNDLVLIRSSS